MKALSISGHLYLFIEFAYHSTLYLCWPRCRPLESKLVNFSTYEYGQALRNNSQGIKHGRKHLKQSSQETLWIHDTKESSLHLYAL